MATRRRTAGDVRARLRRLPALAAVTGLRAGLALLERVSPRLGGRWGEFLFFRVPPTPPESRRTRHGTPGAPFALDFAGRTIRGESWGEAGAPLVVLLHGWGGWRQHLQAYVDPLLAAGCRVVAFDALAHGSSDAGHFEPRTSRIFEIADCLVRVVAEFGQPMAVVAHSGGAMAAMLAMHDGRLAPERAVFVAPSVNVADMVSGLSRAVGLGPRSALVMERRAVRRIGRPVTDFDTAALARDLAARGVLPPALLVHDRGDDETPASGSEALHAAWPRSRLLLTDGLDHRRILWSRAVVDVAVAFLTEPVAAT